MSREAKTAYVSILSALGLIVLLLGIFFPNVLPFTTGLIIAIICWIASGILARYWGVKRKVKRR
jgi:uncharacterized membrane protein YbaN (DUF454 family)